MKPQVRRDRRDNETDKDSDRQVRRRTRRVPTGLPARSSPLSRERQKVRESRSGDEQIVSIGSGRRLTSDLPVPAGSDTYAQAEQSCRVVTTRPPDLTGSLLHSQVGLSE